MRFVVGSDHAGFPLKAFAIAELERLGHEVHDVGTDSEEPVDYPDYALAVGEPVASGEAHRGVLLCGSGVGACIAANKIPGVRAGTCHDTFSAHQGVEDDDMNVICIGARVVGPNLAVEIVRAFQAAVFSDAPRHRQRKQKVLDIEARFAPTPVEAESVD
jgi:ribose 5-phosphate isomerase B